jgi:hypothetical protein
MNQARTSSVSSLQQRNLTARWLALAGVVGPILFLSVHHITKGIGARNARTRSTRPLK